MRLPAKNVKRAIDTEDGRIILGGEMEETKMPRATGYDPQGVPRVYANDDFWQTALAFCKEEAASYVQRRPDTGPLDQWRFQDDQPADE